MVVVLYVDYSFNIYTRGVPINVFVGAKSIPIVKCEHGPCNTLLGIPPFWCNSQTSYKVMWGGAMVAVSMSLYCHNMSHQSKLLKLVWSSSSSSLGWTPNFFGHPHLLSHVLLFDLSCLHCLPWRSLSLLQSCMYWVWLVFVGMEFGPRIWTMCVDRVMSLGLWGFGKRCGPWDKFYSSNSCVPYI